jgi:hypothetical protein
MTILTKLNGQKTAEDVIVFLSQNNIDCKYIHHDGSFALTHTKKKEDFHQLIVDLCDHVGLKAQNDRWFPGSPDSNCSYESDSDYGYYVCPIEFVDGDYEDLNKFDYDFDMLISTQEVTWC